jgi:hypothetical protein
MKSSWFVSLLAMLVVGCVSIKPQNVTHDESHVTEEKSVTRHASRVTLYKATLDIKKHHLTGLLVIKRMDSLAMQKTPAQSGTEFDAWVYRIVFANEIGLTFFDLEMKPDSFKVISCFESLDKKALMKIFETDFRLLNDIHELKKKEFYLQSGTNNLVISGRSGRFRIWQTFSPSGDTLFNTAGKSTIADAVIISYLKYTEGIPTKINIENPLIGLKLSLRLLDIKQ